MRSEDVLARAEEALGRHGGRSRLQQRSAQRLVRAGIVKAKRFGWITAGFLFGVPLFALLVQPIGLGGLMLAFMAWCGAVLAGMLWPTGGGRVEATALPTAPLAQLPLQTEHWLADQRRLLPPPAQRLVDGIGLRLEQLSPQLQRLDEKQPGAFEVRRLIADDLPELVRGFQRVPEHLRRGGPDGLDPEKQLIDGLALVDSELRRMSEQLASGDLTQLATQRRYLELKYQGDPTA